MIASGQDTDVKKAEAQKLLEAFCTGEDVLRWVATRRFLHGFSFRNQILLQVQLEHRLRETDVDLADAMPVQAAWRWKKSGWWPAKTTTLPEEMQGALWVWGPQTRAKDKDGTWKCEMCSARATGPRCPSGHMRRKVFRLKPVFSRLQVTNEAGELPPGPPKCEPLTGESHADLWGPLAVWGRNELGLQEIRLLTHHEDEALRRCGGYYDRKRKRVVVNRATAPNSQVATLIHELAHACGVGYDTYSRSEAEAIVESAAMLACAALGLDTAQRSMAYVAGWAGADGEPPWTVLQRHLRVIDDLARRLEKAAAYDPERADTEAEVLALRDDLEAAA